MRADLIRLARVTAVLLLVVLGTLAPAQAEEGEPTSITIETGVLRWGFSNEANNRAFAPNTYNFFSAGKVPDPGSGGKTLKQADWRQVSGNVSIEKLVGSVWKAATWTGLSTDSNGAALPAPAVGRFSNHQVVFGTGAGTVDREAGTAHIAWTGEVTVLAYSGMSFFYVANPVLDVSDGKGTLKATVSGFGSSQADPDAWVPIAPREVTLADLPEVELGEDGFTALPSYAGVTVSGVGQSPSGTPFGSFPQSFVSFMNELGTAGFWLSTGGSTDPWKPALPLTVSYDADQQVETPTPTPTPSLPEVENEAKDPPKTVTRTVVQTRTTAAQASVPPPAVAPAPATSVPVVAPATTSEVVTLVADHTAPAPDETSRLWWLGGLLFALAALVAVGALIRPSRRALA